MNARTWSVADVDELGVRTDLVTACDLVYGCGRTKAYELHRTGQLDFPVLQAGNRLIVPTAPLRALLGMSPDMSEAGPASPATATTDADGGRHGHEGTAGPPIQDRPRLVG